MAALAVPAGDDGPVGLAALADGVVATFARDVDAAFFDAVTAAFLTRGLASPIVPSSATAPEQLLLEVAATGVPALAPVSIAGRCAVEGVEWRSLGPAAPRVRVVVAARLEAGGPALEAFLAAVHRSRAPRAVLHTVPA
ncbi:MAG TPA: hypothetical protein VF533_10090 [Solirubrobacteraceae bacterium]|jgi:hypothetical protein